jgi:predicted nucleic acid-binding Zn ribbon protein
MPGYVYECPSCGKRNHYENDYFEANDVTCSDCGTPLSADDALPDHPGSNA